VTVPIKTRLEYGYEPADLVEDAYSTARPDFTISLANGVATVTLTTPSDPVPDAVQAAARSALIGLLRLRQFEDRRPFEVKELPKTVHEYPDGRRNTAISVGAGALIVRGSPVEFTITDAAGNVVRDCRAERIAEQARNLDHLGPKLARSPLLSDIVESVAASIDDPENELIHLYEILDAVRKAFGSETAARKALGITKADWSKLGRLANHEPLLEGRHRGEHKESGLRAATPEELAAARSIALRIIDAVARTV
jgi:hypothetical protein